MLVMCIKTPPNQEEHIVRGGQEIIEGEVYVIETLFCSKVSKKISFTLQSNEVKTPFACYRPIYSEKYFQPYTLYKSNRRAINKLLNELEIKPILK